MDLNKIGKTIRAFCKDESGVTAVEYGIIAAPDPKPSRNAST